MNHLDTITSATKELSQGISKLLSVGTFSPAWKDGFGWRHPVEIQEVTLFWLTKLAGIASTLNAAVLLANHGYWFQVGILSRSVTEAHLAITYTLFKPEVVNNEWPNKKQLEAIREHFKETWSDPLKPFADQRQRSHIRNLSAAIGHFQDADSPISSHDASQAAIQNMRMLSDYTHMAYPQIMELFSGESGFLLAGKQKSNPLFGEMELGRLVSTSYIYAETVSGFLRKVYVGCVLKAETEKVAPQKMVVLQSKLETITTLHAQFEAVGSNLEQIFTSTDEEAQRVLRAFKQGKPL